MLFRRTQERRRRALKEAYDQAVTENLARKGVSYPALSATISGAIARSEPYLLVRPGVTESRVLREFIDFRLGVGTNSTDYSENILRDGEFLVGIAPQRADVFDDFCSEYLRVLAGSDALVHFKWTSWMCALPISLTAINAPYGEFDPIIALGEGRVPWTRALEGKRVLVVSPFSISVNQQYLLRDRVTMTRDLLPEFSLITLTPPVTFAGNSTESCWREELRQTVRQMETMDFDVALVSAGSYGPSIAAAARDMGKVGIHVAGALQLFFGIMGKRWEGHEALRPFGHLEGWVRPVEGERPKAPELVEDGCYW